MPARRRNRQRLRARVRDQHRKAKVLHPDEAPPPRSEDQAERRLGWLGQLARGLLEDSDPDQLKELERAHRLNRHLWVKQQRALDRLVENLASGLPWPQAVEAAVEDELVPSLTTVT